MAKVSAIILGLLMLTFCLAGCIGNDDGDSVDITEYTDEIEQNEIKLAELQENISRLENLLIIAKNQILSHELGWDSANQTIQSISIELSEEESKVLHLLEGWGSANQTILQ